MNGEYVCTTCKFRVPADEVGEAIMREHLKEHDDSRTCR